MMTVHYKQACLVELAPTATWQRICNLKDAKKEQTFSASGILFKSGHNDGTYVITHGSILLSHFSSKKTSVNLLKTNIFTKENFVDLKVLVTVDPVDQSGAKLSTNEPRHLNKKYQFNVTRSSIGGKLQQCVGNVECMWKSEGFAKAINTFLPSSEGWSFFEEPEKNTDVKTNEIDARIVAALLPFFVLIKVDDELSCESCLLVSAENLSVGDPVHMVGTPFAAMSPSVFLNSTSGGIVCNTAGKHHELIMTDARCIPGTEGGPLYLAQPIHRRSLVGIVASALCWKANEWIGLSLVCNIREVIHSLNKHKQFVDILDENILDTEDCWSNKDVICCQAPVNHHDTSMLREVPVVLVRCPGSWGSGVVMDHQHGVILTCGHVVKGHKTVRCKLRGRWYDADVVYATSASRVYDIGVLKLLDYTPPTPPHTQFTHVATTVTEGLACYVVGHAVFGQQYNLPPTITCGVISKVIGSSQAPVMIQSTCTVNAGASGGALVARDGTMLGIVSCNAKDTDSGASYPNINLAIPLPTIWPTVRQYINIPDKSILSALEIHDPAVKDLWSMHERRHNFDVLRSKL